MESSDLKTEKLVSADIACSKEAILDLAMEGLAVLDAHLSEFEKTNFIVALGNFNLERLQILAFKAVNRPEIINDTQIGALLDCLVDQILRTRLIMRISAKGILKVPVDGVSID
ncbi:hypothetical protein C0416_01065 [bacterium]|nr:hypothetical protein [bacterium]